MRIILAIAALVFLRTSSLGAHGPESTAPKKTPSTAAPGSDDAGSDDAGSDDAGSDDAGSDDTVEQLVLVLADAWRSKVASLQRYERNGEDNWVKVGSTLPVNLGRNGLSWGKGDKDPMTQGPTKSEGDGTSPAGYFSLGVAFGSAPHPPDGKDTYAYHQAQDNSYCVEDVRSENYNRLVQLEEDDLAVWRQRSPLKRADGLFDWGIFVEHNTTPVEKGRGSCVFLHIWRDYRQSTAGCTSMSKESIELIVGWLRKSANPHLVQLPLNEYERLQKPWELP